MCRPGGCESVSPAKEPAYRATIDLYSGDLLPEDRYEGWAENRREELRQLYLALLVELAGLHEGRGEHERGLEALRRAVREESPPWRRRTRAPGDGPWRPSRR